VGYRSHNIWLQVSFRMLMAPTYKWFCIFRVDKFGNPHHLQLFLRKDIISLEFFSTQIYQSTKNFCGTKESSLRSLNAYMDKVECPLSALLNIDSNFQRKLHTFKHFSNQFFFKNKKNPHQNHFHSHFYRISYKLL